MAVRRTDGLGKGGAEEVVVNEPVNVRVDERGLSEGGRRQMRVCDGEISICTSQHRTNDTVIGG